MKINKNKNIKFVHKENNYKHLKNKIITWKKINMTMNKSWMLNNKLKITLNNLNQF